MEPGSEGETNPRKVSNKNANSSNEGYVKPKRQMKTPFQLQTLEDAYAMETYPSEATRGELSEKLGLTDRQLQTWFCHRRLKEKKETPSKNHQKGTTLPPDSPIDDFRVGPDSEEGSESGSDSGSSPCTDFRKLGGSSSRGMMELGAIACVEAQLGQPLRDDGPMLGMEFDTLPPDAFEAIPELHKRSGQPYENKIYDLHTSKAAVSAIHEYQFLPDHSSLRSDACGQVTHSHFYESPVNGTRAGATLFVHGEEPLSRVHGIQGQGSQAPLLPQRHNTGTISLSSKVSDDPRNNRKRKSDENRIAREVEAQDDGICKDVEKLDNKRIKIEERMRKEVERHERERRKEEERLTREKQREEERLQREKQREEERLQREKQREEERRQKILQKEYVRAEKKRQKEELQREKEEERRRVAREKATTRKIAKESMGLLKDEQLELMEFAAASKGISSIIHLDHNNLKNLESFRDSLSLFPPKSVQLKRPFAIHPWIDSEENVGNLLMAWRFFITFADVLRLWPFTLDEFVQAFHDYESRLLGEIHVALLKSIIKDIEDVARIIVTGLGMNQYSSSHLEGGHPQIVEGAYSWGFDIRSWQHHLNPVTWPEIFRQLAISAGFGPQLKKRSATWTYTGDNHQSKGCEDVVSTLRNGAAAENAFALMRKKGLLLPRKSRHRLTPGTVKFAAFHVLSLEGSKGLTVFELADKIQKSGLRDLTTSKRPEACISVALTRDAKLFERTAPSTYCLRPAYRKDPTDAEAIFAAARKKIQQFYSALLGGEDADEVEKEEVERDEDSEGDVDEDPEVDIATTSNANKDADYHKDEVNICSGSEKVHTSLDGAVNVPGKFDKDLLSFPSNSMKDANGTSNTAYCVIGEENGKGDPDQQNIEIDESKFGESWIQGLSEGEYSHLSVEERLNALVALIGIANEGNSIRTALEDRLEAVNALKKQMWSEAQLDRSLVKEETITKVDFSSVIGMKAEAHLPNYLMEGSQRQFPPADNKHDELSPSNPEDQKPLLCSQNFLNGLNRYPAERTLVLQEASMGTDGFSAQQHGYALKRSRSQFKSYISHRAEEIYAYRSLPLGLDRRCNRYWQFVASASKNDPCAGRIFVELHGGVWRVIDSEEAFDALLSTLDARGIRESQLKIMLQKIETSFKENVCRNLRCVAAINRSGNSTENEASEIDYSPDFPASFDNASDAICGLNSDASEALSSFKVQLGTNENEMKSALNRYQDFQRWMWKECFNCSTLCAMKYGKKRSVQLFVVCDVPEEMHCFHCHQTFGSIIKSSNFPERKCNETKKLGNEYTCTLDSSIPSGISLLKSLCAIVEVSVPPEALESIWTEGHRKIWGMKLNASSSVDEILKILTHLENAIKQDHLSPFFETTRELLGSNLESESDFTDSILPWIPQTTAAVALRLLALDASIMYIKQEKVEPTENKEARTYIKLPSRTSLFIKNKGPVSKELDQDEPMREENFADLSNSKRNKYKRGRGGRGQGSGKKSKRRASNSKHLTSKQSTREKNTLNPHLKQHDQRLGKNSVNRCRTVGKRTERRASGNTMVASTSGVIKPKASNVSVARDLDEDWRAERFKMMQVVNPPDSNSMEEESDDNAQGDGYEQGNCEQDLNGACNDWNGGSMEASDEDDDAYEDDNGIKLQEDREDLDGDLEISDASDEVADDDG
ncbi:homeobox-DDT domain protein RLT1-like isoform X3 [Hibiscus syriacus]|uniref:homeobox-DDT domain protein RLT1-like isoform X3 n=1 Tax=Hibiscus syriacus TaxID=106335 RepID=UPI00192375D4|nr:homeobox-DDT domain protein RLT1-like isoform X3 [Hibiscus syriacus]